MLNTFKKALEQGWQPQVNATIRPDAQITWLTVENICLVPSKQGAVLLDSQDLIEANNYIKGVNNAKK